MPLSISPVPEISISLASPEECRSEPFSPFSPKGQCFPHEEDDSSFRATLLSPPPLFSPRQLSPLRPADSPVKGQGLERDRFEAMMRASRERNIAIGSKRDVDLRKEIAIKVHKSKQAERRALFLSKVQAPPSPTATLTPKTPPESPAIFHYSLPSPGLTSPGEVFEMLALEETMERKPWVEQVDFRIHGHPVSTPSLRSAPLLRTKKQLPSLDQITARLASQGNFAAPAAGLQSARLPAFLQSARRIPAAQLRDDANISLSKSRPTPPPGVGRLQFPVRSLPDLPKIVIREPALYLPPTSPTLAPAPKLQIVTTVVPRTSSVSPSQFTESNLQAWEESSRQNTARNMLTRLRRRTMLPESTRETAAGEDEEERKVRRRSAPPELPRRERKGFSHPVLDLPGAF
ncbi:hypothetical protein BKA93DRAFT_814327 [Sparassis latifolia]|uniref:Uncharacterized protein n=1 Tax=Sparassis crispa TaxID=139825 RepID=A0A401G700_9APHY|nr:predicted protein [Sparassis crispa]GBE77927.1 predicted protein [Sparassis crispa]